MNPPDSEYALRVTDARSACRSGRARLICRDAGLSQAEVARTLGVTPQAVNLYFTGQARPTGDRALGLERLLRELEHRGFGVAR